MYGMWMRRRSVRENIQRSRLEDRVATGVGFSEDTDLLLIVFLRVEHCVRTAHVVPDLYNARENKHTSDV